MATTSCSETSKSSRCEKLSRELDQEGSNMHPLTRLIPAAAVLAAAITIPTSAATPTTATDTAKSGATYARDVAPILRARCEGCHRAGQIGPMPLRSYDEVRPWAKAIAKQVSLREMP